MADEIEVSVGTLGVLNQPGPPMNSGPSGVRPWFPFDGRDERDRESEGGLRGRNVWIRSVQNYRFDGNKRPRPCKNAANDDHQLPGIFSASRRPSEAQSGAIDNSGCYGTFGFSTPAGGRYES